MKAKKFRTQPNCASCRHLVTKLGEKPYCALNVELLEGVGTAFQYCDMVNPIEVKK